MKKYTLSILFSFFFISLFAQPNKNYRLIFLDDFKDTLNTKVWWPQGASGCSTHGEDECEESMWYKPGNIVIKDGKMNIIAKKETVTCGGKTKEYTSGRIQTAAEFLYGYYEISAKLPKGKGFWPAFWLNSSFTIDDYKEIDVMEACGCTCEKYKAGIFYEVDNNKVIADKTLHGEHDYSTPTNICESFNRYGVEWTPTSIDFYFNDKLIFKQDNPNFHTPLPIILNLAIGGCFGRSLCDGWIKCDGFLNWDTNQRCDPSCNTTFPSTYEIEWVKGYQKNNEILYIKGEENLTVDKISTFKAPHYPTASYEWIGSPNLRVRPISWLKIKEGLWKIADVTALTEGMHTLKLKITFPNGQSDIQSFHINARQDRPTPYDDSTPRVSAKINAQHIDIEMINYQKKGILEKIHIQIRSNSGQVKTYYFEEAQQYKIDISQLNKGLYNILFWDGIQRLDTQFTKE